VTASTTTQAGRRNSLNSWTYSDVASQLGIALCGTGSCRGIGNHEQGWTAYGMTVIHWRDRRMTRPGLRRFLKLVATAQTIRMRDERFVRLWSQNVAADHLARRLGVRFPRSLADPDRAKVRLWLAKFRNDHPDRESPEQRELVRRIQPWTRP
jgi:hypothetical protein